jgi:uncharacterized membrane protein YfcA
MKDSLLLLAAGIVASVVAWAFWHYLGKDASSTLVTVMLIVVAADNARLRRQLRARR